MRKAIEVADRREGELIETALSDPTTRAMVKVVGALEPLTAAQRRRVLAWAQDYARDLAVAGEVGEATAADGGGDRLRLT